MKSPVFFSLLVTILVPLFSIPSAAKKEPQLCSKLLATQNGEQFFPVFDTSSTPESLTPSIRLNNGGIFEFAPNRFRASIREDQFQFYSAPNVSGRQRQSNWCWAATIQMLLNYRGLSVVQEHLVNLLFGGLIDRPAGGPEIISVLNRTFPNILGTRTQMLAFDINPININDYLTLIGLEQQPIIVGLKGSSTSAPGHAYLLTGMEFQMDPSGSLVLMESVTLRDPWPDNPSEITMPWQEFLSKHLVSVGTIAIFEGR